MGLFVVPSVLLLALDSQVLAAVVLWVPVIVVNVLAVPLAGSLGFNHQTPSFVAPSPAFFLAASLVVRVVFLSVVPSH